MPQRIPTSKWLEAKLQRLFEMTNIILEVDTKQYNEPQYGFWSLKKEIALMYWIWPHLQIAKEYFRSFYYLDLFAGSGLMKAGEQYFVGSPIVALGATLPDVQFEDYIYVEIDRSRSSTLERRVKVAAQSYNTPIPKVINGDCNEDLSVILDMICKKGESNVCFLAFVDPEGIKDVQWKTIHGLLTHCRGDMILTFPTSGIVRNINMAKENEKLVQLFSAFFGDDGWKALEGDGDEVVEYYKSKLVNINGFRKAVHNIPVKDEMNHRLYDLIFATGSRGMSKAVSDLKRRLDRIKTKDIHLLSDVIIGDQPQLDSFW